MPFSSKFNDKNKREKEIEIINSIILALNKDTIPAVKNKAELNKSLALIVRYPFLYANY
jgi:hypothetical protein